MSACPLVVLACESLHVCTVCIWRCEHARFCVEVFYALYINFHSFIHSSGERRGKRKREKIFLERTREGHRQSDEYWICFKGNVGENSETGWSAYGFCREHRYHLELN